MDLRKGITSVEFWHEFGEDQIHAINSNISINNDELVFECDLKPVDSNQKSDAESIFRESNKITKIIITDELICSGLIKYIGNHSSEFSSIIFIVGFGQDKFRHQVLLKKHELGGLKFIVQA